jgi:hypothetical protein
MAALEGLEAVADLHDRASKNYFVAENRSRASMGVARESQGKSGPISQEKSRLPRSCVDLRCSHGTQDVERPRGERRATT